MRKARATRRVLMAFWLGEAGPRRPFSQHAVRGRLASQRSPEAGRRCLSAGEEGAIAAVILISQNAAHEGGSRAPVRRREAAAAGQPVPGPLRGCGRRRRGGGSRAEDAHRQGQARRPEGELGPCRPTTFPISPEPRPRWRGLMGAVVPSWNSSWPRF